MEIEAQASGTIRDLIAASSEDIPVGSVVAWIDAEGEIAPAQPSSPANGNEAAASAARVAESPASPSAAPPFHAGADAPRVAQEAEARPRATPLARRLARERGLDLGSLMGTGPRGRIKACDVYQEGPPQVLPSPVVSSDEFVAPPPRPMKAEPAPAVAAHQPAARLAKAAGPLNLIRLRCGSTR